ncbi:MAG: hypothetical protein ACRC1K_23235, partial [Planctomycetia bacterium]
MTEINEEKRLKRKNAEKICNPEEPWLNHFRCRRGRPAAEVEPEETSGKNFLEGLAWQGAAAPTDPRKDTVYATA